MKYLNAFRSFSRGLILIFLLMFIIPVQITAQQKVQGEISKSYQFTMKDGSTISGKVISVSDKEYVVESGTLGEIRLQRENIKSMVLISSINEKKSGVWFANPNPTKYLLGSSAIPMEKKSGYYQNTWIFVNSFNYAFTKNFSLSAGFEIFSILAGGEGPYAFYINPKMSFKVANNLYLGGNVLYANTIKDVEDFGGLSTLNGFFTYGNKNNNITAALGWGWADGEFSSKPVLIISGMTRASKRIAFVTENWFVPGVNDNGSLYGIYSYGIRFLGEKTSIDLGFLNNKDIASEIIIGIPWLDFVINF
jgi:hypothetical protein